MISLTLPELWADERMCREAHRRCIGAGLPYDASADPFARATIAPRRARFSRPARAECEGPVQLESEALRPGQPIPAIHGCDGEDRSPDLSWSEIPVETRSFALVLDDPDAPRGVWVHWILFNLPADAIELAAGVPRAPELPSGARQGVNDAGDIGYGGPCPPRGAAHRYFLRLYALDTALNLPPGVNRSDLDQAMTGHILAEAALMGTYQR